MTSNPGSGTASPGASPTGSWSPAPQQIRAAAATPDDRGSARVSGDMINRGLGPLTRRSDPLVDQDRHAVRPRHHPVIVAARLADHVADGQAPLVGHQQTPDAGLD